MVLDTALTFPWTPSSPGNSILHLNSPLKCAAPQDFWALFYSRRIKSWLLRFHMFLPAKQHCVCVSALRVSKGLPNDLSNLCVGQKRDWHLWGHRTCAGGPLWAQSCSLTLQLQPSWQLAIARNREIEPSHLHSHPLYFWSTVISSHYRHTQLPNQQNKLYYILKILRMHVCLPSRRRKSKHEHIENSWLN